MVILSQDKAALYGSPWPTGCKPVVLPLNDAPQIVVAAPGVEPGNVLVYETELVPTSPHQCTKLGPRAGMEPASPGYESGASPSTPARNKTWGRKSGSNAHLAGTSRPSCH